MIRTHEALFLALALAAIRTGPGCRSEADGSIEANDGVSRETSPGAVHRGDSNRAEALTAGEPADGRTSDGSTALHLAVERCQADSVAALLEHGADPDALDRRGQAPLHRITGAATADMVAALIDHGAGLEARDAEGNTPLLRAVRAGAEDAVELLLERGAEPHAVSWLGATALHHAAECGEEIVLSMLLERGVAVDARDPAGRTPLHLALAHRRAEAAERLIAAGADPDAVDGGGRTPLHGLWTGDSVERMPTRQERFGRDGILWDSWELTTFRGSQAATSPTPDLVRILLAAGADADPRDRAGRTPLHGAAARGDEALTVLLEAGANPRHADGRGWTPLHGAVAASEHDTLEAVEALLQRGADPDSRYPTGETPLLRACAASDRAKIDLLLEYGGDPDARTREGRACLHGAVVVVVEVPKSRLGVANLPVLLHSRANDRLQLVDALLDHGADPNLRTRDRRTSLHELLTARPSLPGPFGTPRLAEQDHKELRAQLLETLLAHGAEPGARDARGVTPMDLACEAGQKEIVEVLRSKGVAVPESCVLDPVDGPSP